jgi:rfaE bifunctional protein kinase chain/domain
MNPTRFQAITRKYPRLRIAVVGDFCLDRYLEIDPTKQEVSIETGLPVYNVVKVRSQPGGAGTILNNLAALGIGTIYPGGVAGTDGEGLELRRALRRRPGAKLDHFISSAQRCTFTYTKPLVVEPGKPPRELNRLDTKNWTPTPAVVQAKLVGALFAVAKKVDALILLDQVDEPETGVVTAKVLQAIRTIIRRRPKLLIVADSRRGLRGYPPVCFKMNRAELAALTDTNTDLSLAELKKTAADLSRQRGRMVFITLAEQGILGASPSGEVQHVPALPVRGEIDIVGAGDAVTANLTAGLAAGASLREALELANAAASIVVHQLGTTGTATVDEIRQVLVGGDN